MLQVPGTRFVADAGAALRALHGIGSAGHAGDLHQGPRQVAGLVLVQVEVLAGQLFSDRREVVFQRRDGRVYLQRDEHMDRASFLQRHSELAQQRQLHDVDEQLLPHDAAKQE